VKRVAWLVAAGVSLGCAAGPGGGAAPAPQAAEDPVEYAPFLAGGDAVIEGRAFVRTRGGGTHDATGFPIYLDPLTSYSRAWHRGGTSTDLGAPAPGALFQLARQEATAVDEGRFSFSGLAPGWYYVSALVVWDDGSFVPQTHVLRDSVQAQPGRTVRVVLTRMR